MKILASCWQFNHLSYDLRCLNQCNLGQDEGPLQGIYIRCGAAFLPLFYLHDFCPCERIRLRTVKTRLFLYLQVREAWKGPLLSIREGVAFHCPLNPWPPARLPIRAYLRWRFGCELQKPVFHDLNWNPWLTSHRDTELVYCQLCLSGDTFSLRQRAS